MMNYLLLSVILATSVLADHELENKTLRMVRVENIGAPWSEFLSDLLDELQNNLGFTTTTINVTQYGVKNETSGKWSGQVGKLVDGEADFSLSELTVTPQREEAIDFTTPFMMAGTTALIKKSDVGNMTSPRDLAEQDTIAYGAIKNGATSHLLRTINDTTLNQMYEKMDNSSWFIHTINDGINKVKAGGFAMFLESWHAEYEIINSCDLQTLGQPIATRGYAIGLPKNSPNTAIFSKAIQEMIEAGKIQQLKDKHWKKTASNCIVPKA